MRAGLRVGVDSSLSVSGMLRSSMKSLLMVVCAFIVSHKYLGWWRSIQGTRIHMYGVLLHPLLPPPSDE